MPFILALVGLLGVAVTSILVLLAFGSSGIGIAIMAPAALAGVLLSFLLLGISELLRATWLIESHLRKEANDKAMLAKRVASLA